MKSRFAHLKKKAIALRTDGYSIGSIEARLGIPRSTLSYWFRAIVLSEKQKKELEKRSGEGLEKARVAAVKWHKAQKNNRLEDVAKTGEQVLKCLPNDAATLELALAFLYLGEGAKTRDRTALGSADPRIAKFFVRCLQKIYGVPAGNIRCYLHLRADQNPDAMKHYWSDKLKLPIANFRKPSFDKRTVGKPTFPHYKGVCLIECGKVEIQRRLMYIANGFCERDA